MNKKLILSIIIAAVTMGSALSVMGILNVQQPNDPGIKKKNYNRIISLSPSITETLFALDCGDKVIGVTRFCTFPPEAKQKADIGGYFDPNYEAIAMLRPDLVILLMEHKEVRDYLSELGLDFLIVSNKTIADILSAITTIGGALGAENRAQQLVTDIEKRINDIQSKTKNTPHPRIIISIGRTMGSGTLEEVYIAGKNTYYDELITRAGGINAYEYDNIPYPTLSAEGMLHLNPDIIIELVPDIETRGLSKDAILKEWDSISSIKAVKNKLIYILTQNYIAIPGPRFILLLEDIARIIHPEINLDKI